MPVETTPVPTPTMPAAVQVAATAPAAPVSKSTAMSATPSQPQTVTIPLEQLQTFTSIQTRLAQIESEQRAREVAAQQEQAAILAKKGEVENALNMLRQQTEQQLSNERAARATIEERAKRYALDGEVSRVLASHPLVPGGAEQLTQLWRSQFTVQPEGDSFAVRTPTFQSVSDFVTASLAKPEYAHLSAAKNPGGGTAGTTARHQSSHAGCELAAPPAMNLSQAVILAMASQKKATDDPRLTPALGFGLRAVRQG